MCDVNKRRYSCACPPGFTGHRCQFPPPRSCKHVMPLQGVTANGIYNIVDQQNISFPVYCDFSSEPGATWTLIQSHSLQNNAAFKHKAFYLHDMPVNQDAPNWNSYRLSMSRMKSIRDVSTHWRATCKFDTSVVDSRDYWRVSLQSLDLFAELTGSPVFCLFSDFINIRGNSCTNCAVLTAYSSYYSLHMDSWFNQNEGCDFNGRPGGQPDEDNFGFYFIINRDFRCASAMESTSQFWLGGF